MDLKHILLSVWIMVLEFYRIEQDLSHREFLLFRQETWLLFDYKFLAKTSADHWWRFLLMMNLFREIALHNKPTVWKKEIFKYDNDEKYRMILTWAWYNAKHFGLCNGMRTLIKNCLCSAFKGNANPLIMLFKKLIKKL